MVLVLLLVEKVASDAKLKQMQTTLDTQVKTTLTEDKNEFEPLRSYEMFCILYMDSRKKIINTSSVVWRYSSDNLLSTANVCLSWSK